MLLQNVGKLRYTDAAEHLSTSALWGKSVYEADKMQIHALYQRLSMVLGQREAESVIDDAVRACMEAYLLGDLETNAWMMYCCPLVAEEQVAARMERFSIMERYTIAIAVSASLSLREAITLTWNVAGHLSKTWPDDARVLLKCVPRHIRCPNVFWAHNSLGEPKPLYHLEGEVLDAFGMPWVDVARLVVKVCR